MTQSQYIQVGYFLQFRCFFCRLNCFLNKIYRSNLRFLVGFALFYTSLFATNADAQTYTKHYIAPAPWQYWSKANEVVVATNSTTAVNVTIQKSDGTLMATVSAVAGVPAVYRFSALPSTLPALSSSLNTVLNGAGMIVTGTKPISVNVRNVASDNLGGEGSDANIKGNASLFSFGDAAIGTAFRVGYYRDGNLTGTERPIYTILAIENNTIVKIGGVATATLNAGQSYLFQSPIGTLIETSGPAVMNTSARVDAPGGCGDGAYNPIPPVSSLGSEYVVIRGGGNVTAEQTVIVATEANTTLTVSNFNANGVLQTSNTYNLTAGGSFVQIPNGVGTTQYSSTRIVATKNVVAYAGTATSGGGACEVDVATLAPIAACGGSSRAETYKFRAYGQGTNTPGDLPYFSFALTKSPTDKVFLTTSGGSPNYTAVDIESLSGVGVRRQLGSSGVYVIDFTNLNIGSPAVFALTSSTRLTVAAVQQGGGFSMANYLSPFPEKALKPSLAQANCATATLSADPSSVAPYQWYLDGLAIPGATSSSLVATTSGSYTVTSKLDCGISAQSLPVAVALCNIDRSIVKTVDNATPSVGATVNFTLKAKNLGVGNAVGVSVTDQLPSGYTFVSSNAAVTGTSYNSVTGLWSIGALASNQEITLIITARVLSTGTYLNTATITGTQTDIVPANDVSTATVTPAASITITPSGSDAQTVCINTAITPIVYTISGTATGATVTGLPAGVTFAYTGGDKKLTISGTSTAATSGPQTYTVTTTGGSPNSTTTGTINVNGIVGTPVFNMGASSTRCQTSEVMTYTATAANTTSITYSISPNAAGVINSATGEVIWSSIFTGTATITANAAGCSGPKTAIHTVTVTSTGAITPFTTVCAGTNGGTLNLSGQTAGSTILRWESSIDDGMTWQAIANTTTSLNYLNLTTTTAYRAVVNAPGATCSNTYSLEGKVTVTPLPVVTNQLVSICGGSGTFTVSPMGVPAGTTYSWAAPVKSPAASITGGTAASNQNAISQTLSITGSAAGTVTYTVTPTYLTCPGTPFQVVVNLVPAITVSAANPAAICSATAFSVSPTSSVTGMQYTWTAAQLSGGTVTGFSNQTIASVAPISQVLSNTSSSTGIIRYTVTPALNGCSGAAFTFDVSVNPALIAGTTGADQAFCVSGNPIAFTELTAPAGGSGTYTYQWQSSTDNVGFTNIGGATSATYDAPVITQTTYYRRVVTSTGSDCTSQNSNVIKVTVNLALTAGTVGNNQIFCVSGDPLALTEQTAATGGEGVYTYQWQGSTDNVAFTNIPGATAQTYDPAVISVTTYYRRQVNSILCGAGPVSNVITVTVYPVVTAGTVGANQVFCQTGIPAAFTELTSPTGGDLTYTYQWQSSTTSASAGFADIVGANQKLYAANVSISQTTYYRRMVGSPGATCAAQAGNVVTITINPAIGGNALTAPAVTAYCDNGNPVPVVGSTPTGGSGTYTYSWQQSTDNGSTWTAVPAATAKDFDPPALTATTQYRRIVQSGGCSDTAAPITITISKTPTVAVAGPDQQHCTQDLFNLSGNTPVNGTGIWAVVSGQATIDNPTSPTSTVNVLQGQMATLSWTISNGVCPPSTDQITLINYAASGLANAGQNITQNNSGTFTMQANVPNSGTGMWTVKPGSTATIANPANPNTTVTIAPNTSATLVWTVSNGTCPGSTSEVTITYTLSADIKVIKSVVTPGPFIAGQLIVYRILVTNDGPSDAAGLKIADNVPADMVVATINASGSGNASVTQNVSSGNTIDVTANIKAGGGNTVTIDATGTVKANYSGALTNTATVTSPNVPDPDGATSTVTSPVTRKPVLSLVKEGPSNAIAGDAIAYKITISNTGTGDAVGTTVSDILPVQISNPVWTLGKTGAASFAGSGSGTGNVNFIGSIPAGAGNTIVINVSGTVLSSATGSFTNTAKASPAEPDVQPVNSNTVTTNLSGKSGLVMLKNGPAAAQAGTAISYSLKVTNNGLSDAMNATITDLVPAEIKNVSWTSSVAGTAVVSSGGTGTGNSITLKGNIPTGGNNVITITVNGTIDASFSGTSTNTATATPSEAGSQPSGSTVNTTVGRTPVVTILKKGPATLTAGQPISYTIEATNSSVADAKALVITDNVPAQLSNVIWTASTTGTANIIGSGNGTGNSISTSGNLPAGTGNKITITVTGTVASSFNGALVNTATGTPAEPGTTPGTSTVSTQVGRVPVLSILKAGPATITAGGQITYTVDVTNTGTSDALLAAISDAVPASIKNVSWTTAVAGAASVSTGGTGTGNAISQTANIPAGSANKVTLTIKGTVDAAFSGSIVNTAKATPAEAGTTEVTSTATTTASRTPVLSISKTGPSVLTSGQNITYTITVNNFSNSDAKALIITDQVPATVSVSNWSAVATANAIVNGAASGTGNNINVNADLPAGAGNAITITVNGKISAAFSGTLTNTATATPAEPGTVAKSSSSTTTVNKTPVLTIQKGGPGILSAGDKIFYTLTIANASTANADNATIEDIIPATISNVSWTTSASGSAQTISGATGTGNNVQIKANIPAGAANSITVNISGTVSPSATGQLVNAGTVTPAEPGTQPGSSTLTTNIKAMPAISLAKTGPSEISAGQTVTYTVTASNNGPSDASNLSITDAVPGALTNVSWTAAKLGTAAITNGAAGIGNNILVKGNIAAGAGNQIIITITGNVPASAISGSFTNTATATPSEPGVPPVNSNTITTTLKQKVTISAVKSAAASLSAGENITFTLQIKNTGPSDAQNLLILDELPAGINNISWSAATSGTASILSGGNGTGSSVNIRANLPAGAANGILVTVTGKVDPNFSGTQLQNTFTVTPAEPGNPVVPSNTTTTQINKTADIQVSKTGPMTGVAGQAITYQIKVNNAGPSNTNNVSINDQVPAGILNVNWAATAQNGAVINGTASGAGNTIAVLAAIPAGAGTVTIAVNGTIDPAYVPTSITNTATAIPEAGVTDPTPATSTVTTNLSRVANVRIVKSGPADITAGELIQYTLRITNQGPSLAPAVKIADNIPAGITLVSWSATVAGNAAIIGSASGTGNVNLTADISSTGEVNVLVTGTVSPGLTAGSIISNTATADLPSGSPVTDPDPGSNTSTVTTTVNQDVNLKISKSGPATVNIGDQINYRIEVKNGGISNITNALITDNVPVDVAVNSWTVSVANGATIDVGSPTSGTTNTISTTGNIPATVPGLPGAAIIINVQGTVKTTAGAMFTNTAVVTANEIKASSIVTAVNQSTDIYVEKDGPQTAAAGTQVTYQIKVGNAGPIAVTGLGITDNIPAAIKNITWTATAFGDAATTVTGSASGNTANIQTTANITAGAANYIIINVQGTLDPSTVSGSMTNTASLTVPAGINDFNLANNTSSVTTAVASKSGIVVRKTGPATGQSGTEIVYTIVVNNTGPSNAVQANIDDIVPADIKNVTWTATKTGAANVTAGNTGSGNSLIVKADIPAGTGNEVQITVKGTVDAGFAGTLTNRAVVTPAEPGNPPVNSGDVITNIVNRSGLSIVKSGPSLVDAGRTLQYTLEVTNTGPGNAVNAEIRDAVPTGLNNVSWSATAMNGAQLKSAATGTTNPVLVTADLPAGPGKVIVQISADVPANTALTSADNTASVTPVEPGNPNVVSNQVTTAVVKNVNIVLTKSAPATLKAGQEITYTLALSNNGPSEAIATGLSDMIPAQIGNVSWTSTVSGGALITSGATGNGNNLGLVANLPVNASLLVKVKGTVDPAFAGTLTNTATANPSEPGEIPVTAQAVTEIKRSTNLTINKSGAATAVAGQDMTYQIIVANNGPSTALNAVITDAIPVQMEQVSWTASVQGAAVITAGASGTGNTLSVTATFPAGQQNSIVINVKGKIASSYGGTISNKATVTPGDPDNPAVTTPPVETVISQRPVIVLSKTGPASATAGGAISYVIEASNTGLSDAANLVLTDIVPAEIKNVNWKAVVSGVSTLNGTDQGAGNNISLSVNIPASAGNKVTITVNGTVDPATPAGKLLNKATATPSEPGNLVVTSPVVETDIIQRPLIAVRKTGPPMSTAGGQISYVIEVGNTGLSNAKNLAISDNVASDIKLVTWTAIPSGGSSINGAASGSGNNILLNANIPAGADNKISITVTGTINPAFAGRILNTATATPAEPGNPAITSPPVETVVGRLPLLVTTKTGQGTAVAGGELAYVIEVVNTGLSDALAFSVFDDVPAQLGSVNWTATASGTGRVTSGTTGTGNQLRVTADLPAGSGNNKITINLKGTVDPSFAGKINNVARSVPADDSIPFVVTPPVETEVGAKPGIIISKNGPASAISGSEITYIITVGNTGLSNARSLAVNDQVPATLSNVSWTAITSGTAVINTGATGTGNALVLNADIPAGLANTVAITVKGRLSAAYNGNLVNTAVVTPSEPGTVPVSDASTTVVNKIPVLAIVKNGPASIAAGQPIVYTLNVSNTGTANADNAAITDQVPVNISNVSWTAVVQGNATITNGVNGNGNAVNLNANIPAGAGNSILVTIKGTVNAATTADLVNTAIATPAESGSAAVNSVVTTKVSSNPAVTLVKTGPSAISAGEVVTYTLTAGNNGPSDARNLSISDVVPAALANVSWTAATTGNAAILTGASGTGNNVLLTGNISAGSGNQIVVTITGKVPASASAGSISNTAKATPGEPGIPPISSNNIITTIDHKVKIRAVKSAPSTIAAGQGIAYTLQVFNDGPGDAVNLAITDIIPSGINNVSWSATTSGAASIAENGNGTGSNVALKVNIPAGSGNAVSVMVKGDVDPGFTGTTVKNSFTATPSETGNPPVTAEEVTTAVTKTADIQIQKTAPSSLIAGSAISYTITVKNAGPSNAPVVNITDVIPAGLSNVNWTAAGQNGAVVNGTANGAGNININASIPAGNAIVLITINAFVNADFAGTSMVNTAAATPGPGITDPTPAVSTVTTTISRMANVRITKSGPSNIAAGEMMTYNLRIVNDGPSDATGILIKDVVPASLEAGATWTATVLNGATVSGASGTGDVDITGNIPAGTGEINIELKGKVKASNADGAVFINTATVNFPSGSPVTDPDLSSNTSSVITRINNDPVLMVSKSGPSTVDIGDPINYTIVIRNGGAGDIFGAQIADPVPNDVAVSSWNVVRTGGASITGATSGTGSSITTMADIPADGNPNTAITINISGTVKATAGATFTNKVTVTANGIRESSVVTAVNQSTDIAIEKAGPQAISAGSAIAYTVKVSNNGPVDVAGLTIRDNVPVEIGTLSWSAQAFGTASITGANSGNTNAVLTQASVPVGAANYVLISIKGIVKPGTPSGSIINTANVDMPAGMADFNLLNNTSSVETTVGSLSGLVISKTGPQNGVSGSAISYVIRVVNNGPSNAVQAVIKDAVPVGITTVSWTAISSGTAAVTTGSAGTGNAVAVTANIPAGTGNEITITVSGTIDPGLIGPLVNTAVVTPAEPGNPPVTSGTVTTNVANRSGIRLIKSGPSGVEAGKTVNYTLELTNTGPGNAMNVDLSDIVPAPLGSVSWAAAASNGAVIRSGAIGTGNAVSLKADVPAGTAKVTVNITGLVPANTMMTSFSNAATARPTEVGNPAVVSNAIATAIVNNANLNLSKSGPSGASSGEMVVYTLLVGNSGPSDATGVKIRDVVPAQLSGVTWNSSVNGGAVISSGASGSVNDVQLTVNIPVNGSIAVMITGKIDPLFTGLLTNRAILTLADPTKPAINSEVTTTVKNQSSLKITKTGQGAVVAGQEMKYQIVLRNSGPSTAQNAVITDHVPAEMINVSWTAVASGAAGVSRGQSGTGNNLSVAATVPPGQGDFVTINITGTVDPSFSGKLFNMATAAPTEPGNPAVVTPPVETQVSRKPGVIITKTGPQTAKSGELITYVVEVTNSGLSDGLALAINDKVSNDIANVSWTTTVAGKAKILTGTSGNGNSVSILADLPTGGANKITLTITGTVSKSFTGKITNTARSVPSEGLPEVLSNAVETVVDVSDFVIPNIITPNNDGNNDTFKIKGLENYPGTQVLVFNRWGNEVFRGNNYTNDWDGSQLNEGTYYYLINRKEKAGTVTVFKGWLFIKR
jgi:gliding motility-associated-like protein/uncharacterized repeat protein (TIGR01451 family)